MRRFPSTGISPTSRFTKTCRNIGSDLLHVYQKYPALWQLDSDWNGFQWINANDGDRSIFSFIRRDETGKKNLLFVINFTPVARDDYRVGVPEVRNLLLILDSGAWALQAAASMHSPPAQEERVRWPAILLCVSAAGVRDCNL